jgi:DNA ligase-1
MITSPILAAKKPVFENIKFPVLATPKIDGIRCIKVNGQALSRSFKPIPNHHIRKMIEQHCPDGFDGEILCGDGFSDVQSMVMGREGTPDFTYLVFDYVKESLFTSYIIRVQDLQTVFEQRSEIQSFCKALIPVVTNDLEELKNIMALHLEQGHEGTMIRSFESPYKCGRASLKEGFLTAIKYFEDGEAEVYGFEELMHNENEQTKDSFGNSERSSKKENMVPGDTLGAFLVRKSDGIEFKIGTGKGLTATLRKEIWKNKESYLGKLVHYRSQPHGVKDKPRIPVWHGFRHQDDTSK